MATFNNVSTLLEFEVSTQQTSFVGGDNDNQTSFVGGDDDNNTDGREFWRSNLSANVDIACGTYLLLIG